MLLLSDCPASEFRHTFFGRLKVTLVMPGTLIKPSLAIDFLAFFSLREWTTAVAPPGMLDSPASISESESSDASSSTLTFLTTSSSASSSMRGLDMVKFICENECLLAMLLVSGFFELDLKIRVVRRILADRFCSNSTELNFNTSRENGSTNLEVQMYVKLKSRSCYILGVVKQNIRVRDVILALTVTSNSTFSGIRGTGWHVYMIP
jgi:hypothetical protein